MKKIIIPILVFLFLVGCSASKATPKSAVEDMLKKYQSICKNYRTFCINYTKQSEIKRKLY